MKKKLWSLLIAVALVLVSVPAGVKADVRPGSWSFIIATGTETEYHVYDILDMKKGGAQQYAEFTFNYRNWEFKPTQDMSSLKLEVKTESNPMIKTSYDKHTYTWRLEGERTIESFQYNGFSEGASKTIHVIGNGTLKIKSERYSPKTNEEGETLYTILYKGEPIRIFKNGGYEEAAYESLEAFRLDYENIKENIVDNHYSGISNADVSVFTLGGYAKDYTKPNTGALTNEEYQELLKYFDFDATHYQASLKDGYLVITGESNEEAKNIPMLGSTVSSKGGIIYSDKEEFDASYQSLKLEDITDQATEQQKTGIRITGEKELVALYDISAINDETGEEIKLKDGKYEVWIKLTDKMREYLSASPDAEFTVAYVDNNEVKEMLKAEIEEDEMGSPYLVFTTTHFSNYAILGNNVEVTQKEKDDWEKAKITESSNNSQTQNKENPKTSDPIMMMTALFACGGAGTIATCYTMKKRLQK